jgi:hypothetical protein
MAIVENEIDFEKREIWIKEINEYRTFYYPKIKIDGVFITIADDVGQIKCETEEKAIKVAREYRDSAKKKINSSHKFSWMINKKHIRAVIITVFLAINWNGIYQLLNLLRMYLLGQLVMEINDISWVIPSITTSIFSYLLWKVTKMNFEYQLERNYKEEQSEFILVLIKLNHLKISLSTELNNGILVFDHDIEKAIMLSKEIEIILTQSIIKHLDTFESFDAYFNNFISKIDCLQVFFELEKSNRNIRKVPKYIMEEKGLEKFQVILNSLNGIVSNLEKFLNIEYEKIYKRSIFTEKLK